MRLLMQALAVLVLLALAAGPALADEIVSLKVGYLSLSPKGSFAATVDGVGTRIDMENDLNFKDSRQMMAEAALQLGDFHLSAGYLPIKFSGSGTLTRSINFNGRDYSAGTRVDSDVDIKLYDVGLTYYLVNLNNLPVRLQIGPEIAVKIADADLSVTDLSSGIKEETTGTVPVPTVGGRFRVALADYLGVVGRVGYMAYGGNHFLDADAQVEFSPLPLVGIFAGYRYFDLHVDHSATYLDATFSGPYGGAFVRF
jgi:outer membrane protein